MSVTVPRTLRETDEDFIGGRVGWSHTTSLTDRICTPKLFSSGGLFFRTNVFRTLEGKNPVKRPKNGMFELCSASTLSATQMFRKKIVSFYNFNLSMSSYSRIVYHCWIHTLQK